MLKQDEFVKGQLVSLGWRFGQSYGGGHIAGELVMHAIANRVRCGWGSWLQVIENIPTFMAENEIPILKYPSVWEPAFVRLLHSVEGVFDGSTLDTTHGGLYWADLGRIERPWFMEKIVRAVKPTIVSDGSGVELPQHARVANMNSLVFWS